MIINPSHKKLKSKLRDYYGGYPSFRRWPGDGRNPGGESTIWIPAFAGMTFYGFPKTGSFNLG